MVSDHNIKLYILKDTYMVKDNDNNMCNDIIFVFHLVLFEGNISGK